MPTLAWAGIAAIAVAFQAGCGNPVRVDGRVTLDGKPLTTGEVQFHAKGRPIGWGSIDLEGRFRIRTARGDGLTAADKYTATVTAVQTPATAARKNEPVPIWSLITPARYGTMETSGLSFELRPGMNRLELELTSK